MIKAYCCCFCCFSLLPWIQWFVLMVDDFFPGMGNEMNRALGHLCAHIGQTGPGEPPEDGEMIKMTLSSRHMIRNSSPGGLRPSTLPLDHEGSPQYWLSHLDGEETFFVSFKPPRPGTEPRTLGWKAAVLTTTLRAPALLVWDLYSAVKRQTTVTAHFKVTAVWCLMTVWRCLSTLPTQTAVTTRFTCKQLLLIIILLLRMQLSLQLWINSSNCSSTLSARGSTLDVWIWRQQTSDSDV